MGPVDFVYHCKYWRMCIGRIEYWFYLLQGLLTEYTNVNTIWLHFKTTIILPLESLCKDL